jgi:hypothetical protein
LKITIPIIKTMMENRKLYPSANQEKVPCPRNPNLNVSITDVNGLD